MTKHKQVRVRQTSDSNKLAMKLYLEGNSITDISRATGRTEGALKTMLMRARQAGKIPKIARGNGVEYLCRKSGVRMGTSREIVSALARDQVEWLFSESIRLKTRSVAEYITEIVRDAYEEEMEKRHGHQQ